MEENKPIQNELYEQCDNVANGKLTAIRKQQCVPFGTQMLVYLNVSKSANSQKDAFNPTRTLSAMQGWSNRAVIPCNKRNHT